MNSITRAVTICPNCGTEQEVWFRYGTVVPIESVECSSCETIYTSSEFIVKLLELRTNLTVSSLMRAAKT
jgi:hypothetical protein